MLDTLKISKRFIEAGMTKSEAEAVAKTLKEHDDRLFKKLATKKDVEHLKEYIKLNAVLITMGFAVLGFLIAYLQTC